MKSLPVDELLELPVAERIRLVELIWESIAAVPEAVPVSDDLRAELERRLADFEANPEAGMPWEEVRERIVQGRWRTGKLSRTGRAWCTPRAIRAAGLAAHSTK